MSGWDEFCGQRRGAIGRFVNGDAVPYKQFWSRAEDVTIFWGWGGYEQRLGRRQQASGLGGQSFRGGHVDIGNLAAGSGGDLADSIDIERNVALVDGATRLRPRSG